MAPPDSEVAPEMRQSIRKRLLERKAKILSKAVVSVQMPTEISKIRELCTYFYRKRDPWFKKIQAEVDIFIKEVHRRLESVGITDPRAFDVARDMVVSGLGALYEERPGSKSFIHHFGRKAGSSYGLPLLADHLEALMLLDQLLDHMSELEEGDPSFEVLLKHADRYHQLVVQSMARPGGGLALTERVQRMEQYRAIIAGGWRRLLQGSAPRREPVQRHPRSQRHTKAEAPKPEVAPDPKIEEDSSEPPVEAVEEKQV